MKLSTFPRIRLVQAPTPLHRLPRLSQLLGGPDIYIKRDDNTGFALGGNKTRKLEFLLGDALSKGATHVVTQGARQSNHVRQTVAAAASVGLRTTALLESRIADTDADYDENGNVLLDRIFGATLEYRPAGLDMNQELVAVAQRLRDAGEVPYLIPGGGSNAIGALGYVEAAQELLQQINDQQLDVDQVVHATGSTGTQAGLLVGLQGNNSHIPLLGISVRAPRDVQRANVARLARETWSLLGIRGELDDDAVQVNADYVGKGYGIPTQGTLEALQLLARTEGILLDPVYSAKGFAGLIDLIRQGAWRKGQTVVFVHTGGAAALSGYRSVLSDYAQTHAD